MVVLYCGRIWYYSQRSSWHEKGNPYFMPSGASSSCEFRCEKLISFRYETADHSEEGVDLTSASCIPFIAASTICGLFDPPRYALGTPIDNTELTVREICSSCAQTKPNAVLISSTQTSDDWWNSRSAIVGSSRDAAIALKSIQCRYTLSPISC